VADLKREAVKKGSIDLQSGKGGATMPIAGISDKRRLPRLGKIRLGEKAVSEKTKQEYPKAVDYFVVPDVVKAIYGEKPRALDIVIPHEDQEIYFSQYYRRYGSGSGLICKGNGVKAIYLDKETGEMQEVDCVPDECEAYEKKHCRATGFLQFLLPRVPGLGVWQIDTSSYHSIINLNSAFELVRAAAGRVAFIPLKLIVRPQEVAPDGKKKVVYVMDIDTSDMSLKGVQALGAAPATQMFALEPPKEDESPDDLYPRSLREGKTGGNGQPKPEVVEAEVVDEERPPSNPIEKDIEEAFNILGYTQAKRTLKRRQFGKPEELLKALNLEIDSGKQRARPAVPASPPSQKACNQRFF
jgi:hypothetical protein